MHSPDAKPDGVYLFGALFIDKDMGTVAPTCLNEDFPDGTWIHFYYVENDEVWNWIKQGKIKGFSVEGMFSMKESFSRFSKTQSNEADKLIDEIDSIVKKVTK
jgi:hypothetical protein